MSSECARVENEVDIEFENWATGSRRVDGRRGARRVDRIAISVENGATVGILNRPTTITDDGRVERGVDVGGDAATGDSESGDGVFALQDTILHVGEFRVVAAGRVIGATPRHGLVILHTTQEILRIADLFVMPTDIQPIPGEHSHRRFVLPATQVAGEIPLT